MSKDLSTEEIGEEPPPFFGSWLRVYTAVLAYLLVLVVFLYLITRYFAV